ncbi:hypothetical protein CEXT_150311, partial [Caerostris extrusa]
IKQNLLKCSWSPDGAHVNYRWVSWTVSYIWDTTRRLLYQTSGHNGSVNEVNFHQRTNNFVMFQ